MLSTCENSKANQLWRDARIPERHSGKIVLRGAEWLAMQEKVLNQIGNGFLIALIGKRGTGKTQLAVTAIRKACKAGKSGLYVKTKEIFMDIRSTYNSSGHKDERRAIQAFLSPRLLVIDEAHERGETAWEDGLLTYIIDKRYDNMTDTLLISNQDKPEFQSSMGPSIVSRLQETGGIAIANWDSYRA